MAIQHSSHSLHTNGIPSYFRINGLEIFKENFTVIWLESLEMYEEQVCSSIRLILSVQSKYYYNIWNIDIPL